MDLNEVLVMLQRSSRGKPLIYCILIVFFPYIDRRPISGVQNSCMISLKINVVILQKLHQDQD
jgi:hypothetical protein